MKHAAKRLLTACLALLLVVGLVPAALAAEPGVLTDTSGPATLTAQPAESTAPPSESETPTPPPTEPSPSPTPEPKPVPVTSVSLNKSSLSLSVGEAETLRATVQPDDAAEKGIRWDSDRPDVASVSSTGMVTARAAGTVCRVFLMPTDPK